MITTDGKVYIKRFLAQQVPTIAQSIGFGIGTSAESSGSTRLDFEVGRADVNLISYDFVNDKLIFKATVPAEYGGKIYEVSLFALSTLGANAEFGSRVLTTLDSDTETWVDATSGTAATFSSTNARVGDDALRHTPSASGSKTDALKDIDLDLSGYSSADRFILALNNTNSYASSVNVKFLTDVSNYYQVNFGTPSVGYNVLEVNKGAAAVTGTPSWANITEIRITTNASAGGSPTVDYDGIRIQDLDNIEENDIMVSREVLSSPFTKVEGMTQEVEFALSISI